MAVLIVLAQIGLTIVAYPSATHRGFYTRLNEWDSDHYLSIVREGYHLPEGRPVTREDVHEKRANLGFFPGLPMLARGLHESTGISPEVALLLVAQAFAVLMWWYFLMFLGRLKLSTGARAWAVGAALVYPSAFFLVAGYTEPMFAASVLGFIYWSDRWLESGRGALGAALSGLAMTASRFVGIPLVVYPVLRAPRRIGAYALAAVALGGVGAFFAYCQWKFGEWNLYFRLQQLGWGNHPAWFAIMDPRSYLPRFFFEDTVVSVNRAANAWCLALFAWIVWKDLGNLSKRWPQYFMAFAIFYISLAGKASENMDSMLRYTLPVYLMQLLFVARIVAERKVRLKRPLFLAGGLAALVIQIYLIIVFVHGHWVA
ncbi:MAG: hypothetical protein ACXVCH_11950 [Bdellovibrionota bacterium]